MGSPTAETLRPLSPAELDILLIVRREDVSEVAAAIEENRSVVSQVMSGARSSGEAVRRVQRKLEKHFALKPGLIASRN